MEPLDRFAFSQSSLQDFVDCRRRFQLRYLQRVAWPALRSEPARENERHIQRGERFHRLVQQYLTGVPEDRLTRMAGADEDANLLRWWHNFIDCVPQGLTGRRHVETTLCAPLGSFRVLAKYDLVLVKNDGRVVIYDWKTSLNKPRRDVLMKRMQTRIYPYLLARAGAELNRGCDLEPEQIQMIYWFAEPDQPPELLGYSREQYLQDADTLLQLLQEVRGLAGSNGRSCFPMCDSESACRYCVYRSLCDRGVRAGDLFEDGYEPSTVADGLNFNLEQIGEISF